MDYVAINHTWVIALEFGFWQYLREGNARSIDGKTCRGYLEAEGAAEWRPVG
jgi:hypothetical protein